MNSRLTDLADRSAVRKVPANARRTIGNDDLYEIDEGAWRHPTCGGEATAIAISLARKYPDDYRCLVGEIGQSPAQTIN
jgi:hypothetical protein